MRVAQGDLAGALAAYEESLAIRRDLAAADPGNAGWQRDLSVSLNKLGDVRGRRATSPARWRPTRRAWRSAQARGRRPGQRRLAARPVGEPRQVGDVRLAQGDLAGALGPTRRACDRARARGRATRATPAGSATCRSAWNKLGDVRVAQGDRAGALAAYEESLAIRATSPPRDPGNAGWQRDSRSA